jgi:hypothetical protein
VNAKYTGQVSSTVSTSAPVQWNTKEFDSHNAVTTGASWRFTAPISGVYRLSCVSAVNSGAAEYAIYRDGTVTNSRLMTVVSTSANNGSSTIRLNAGQYIDVRPTSSSFTTNNATDYNICIDKVGN